MMRKLLAALVVLFAAGALGVYVTAPGEIAIAGQGSQIMVSNLARVQDEARRNGQVVVWTSGIALDTGRGAVLLNAVPVAMDRADVGKHGDLIKNPATRAKVAALHRRQQDWLQAQTPDFRRQLALSMISDADAMVSSVNLGIYKPEIASGMLSVRDDLIMNASAYADEFAGFDEICAATESGQALPEKPAGCDYGDVCEGCYTATCQSTGPNSSITFCQSACIDCFVQP